MKCPACHRTLTAVTVSGVTVDVCHDGCAGMWFDQGESHWFDQPTDTAGQALLEMTGNAKVSVDFSQRRRCPKCPDSVLMRHFFGPRRAVTVDECPTCAGIWLDAGELERIRTEYDSAEARRQAAGAGFEEVLVGDRMALMRTEIEEQLPYDTSQSRVVASVVVVLNLLWAFKAGGAAATATRLYISIVPWACVCFTDSMSARIGPVFGVTRQSPRAWLWFFAWLVLLLPEIQLAILWVEAIRLSPFAR